MSEYKSKFTGPEIDERLKKAEAAYKQGADTLATLNAHKTQLDLHTNQIADHEKRLINAANSAKAIGDVATANQTAIKELQEVDKTNSTRFTAMDQQIANLYSAADINASSSAVNASAIGMSRRNLLPNIASSITKGGITFTVNEDGGVTASGTASANTQLDIGKFSLTAGTEYILSGCPDGGSESSYYLYGLYTSNWAGLGGKDTGSGYKFTAQWSGEVVFRVYITSGTTIDNLTFYPMLRYAAIEDGTYETYTPSLLERIEALEAKILSLTTEVSE